MLAWGVETKVASRVKVAVPGEWRASSMANYRKWTRMRAATWDVSSVHGGPAGPRRGALMLPFRVLPCVQLLL